MYNHLLIGGWMEIINWNAFMSYYSDFAIWVLLIPSELKGSGFFRSFVHFEGGISREERRRNIHP